MTYINRVPVMTPVDELPPKKPGRKGSGERNWNWQMALGMIAGKGWHLIEEPRNLKTGALNWLTSRVDGCEAAQRDGRWYLRFDPPESHGVGEANDNRP